MSADQTACASSDFVKHWDSIDWSRCERGVRRLRNCAEGGNGWHGRRLTRREAEAKAWQGCALCTGVFRGS